MFRDCGVCDSCLLNQEIDEKGAVSCKRYLCLNPKKFEKKSVLEKINHPEHYGGDTTYEAIKVIEAWKLGFCLGNAVKYICRADTKGMKLADLKKAVWYINREIKRYEDEISTGDVGPIKS